MTKEGWYEDEQEMLDDENVFPYEDEEEEA